MLVEAPLGELGPDGRFGKILERQLRRFIGVGDGQAADAGGYAIEFLGH